MRSRPEASEEVRVLVADDHSVVRAGLRAILEGEPGIQVVGEAANGADAVAQFRALRPDLCLVDLRMPAMDGAAAAAEILREQPDAAVMVISNYEGDEDVHRALDAGALTYIGKRNIDVELLPAIEAWRNGRSYTPSAVASVRAAARPRPNLTSRELEVLKRLVEGDTNKGIAVALDISVNTVNTHVMRILDKLGVDDRTKAATTAIFRGIVHLD